MENIVSISGKLLYFGQHLCKTKQISHQQLALFKDLIFSNNEEVMDTYEEYIRSGTELTLASRIIHLLQQRANRSQNSEDSCSEANSQGSKRHKRGGISIAIPKRHIQKLPTGLERL